MDKVLKWQSGAVRWPCREAESVDELFIPVDSSSHPHSVMEMSPPTDSLIKATQLDGCQSLD